MKRLNVRHSVPVTTKEAQGRLLPATSPAVIGSDMEGGSQREGKEGLKCE
jgi:hypothetical protein